MHSLSKRGGESSREKREEGIFICFALFEIEKEKKKGKRESPLHTHTGEKKHQRKEEGTIMLYFKFFVRGEEGEGKGKRTEPISCQTKGKKVKKVRKKEEKGKPRPLLGLLGREKEAASKQ